MLWFEKNGVEKALLVGATRRATVAPFAGDQQLDWVIRKYTYYYNSNNQLLWRTDGIALLGVRDGQAGSNEPMPRPICSIFFALGANEAHRFEYVQEAKRSGAVAHELSPDD